MRGEETLYLCGGKRTLIFMFLPIFCKIFRLLNIKPRLMLDLIYGKSGWGGNTHKRIVVMKQSECRC